MTRAVRILVTCFIGLSLVLTWVAIREGVAYRFGGSGSRDLVARDSVFHGTGISTPLVALLTFAVLLPLTWVPGRWRAVPLFLPWRVRVVPVIAPFSIPVRSMKPCRASGQEP